MCSSKLPCGALLTRPAGVIKGSELALSSEKGFLDKDAYHNLSHRTQGTFANQRETIYKLFVAYMKRKRDRREYDAADRYELRLSGPVGYTNSGHSTHVLLKALEQYGLPGKQIDFLFASLPCITTSSTVLTITTKLYRRGSRQFVDRRSR